MSNKVDTGLMGSIIRLWIKFAHAEKYFSSKLISLKERFIVVRNVFINIGHDQVVLSMFWLKRILPVLKKVRNLGIKDFLKRKPLNGKETMSGMMACMTGLKDNLANQKSVRYVGQLIQRYFSGPIKTINIKENYQIINVCVLSAM